MKQNTGRHRAQAILILILLCVVSALALAGCSGKVPVASSTNNKAIEAQAGTGDIQAMRNISAVTAANVVPELPDKVCGVTAEGALAGEFSVVWDMAGADFSQQNTVVTVNGSAVLPGGQSMPVKCFVRIAASNPDEGINAAKTAVSLTEDCTVPTDSLASVRDGIITTSERSTDSGQRWTNWNVCRQSDSASITFTWEQPPEIDRVNLYFFKDNFSAQIPKDVVFEYSTDGVEFTQIGYTKPKEVVAFAKTEYLLDEVIKPTSLRITLTQQGGTGGHCVGLTEVEIITYVHDLTPNSTAWLEEIQANGAKVADFNPVSYTCTVDKGKTITAVSQDNAAVTVLPEYNGQTCILVLSEDGSTMNTYTCKPGESSAFLIRFLRQLFGGQKDQRR